MTDRWMPDFITPSFRTPPWVTKNGDCILPISCDECPLYNDPPCTLPKAREYHEARERFWDDEGRRLVEEAIIRGEYDDYLDEPLCPGAFLKTFKMKLARAHDKGGKAGISGKK